MAGNGTNVNGIVAFGISDPVGMNFCDIQLYNPALNTWTDITHPLECRQNTTRFNYENNLYSGDGIIRIS